MKESFQKSVSFIWPDMAKLHVEGRKVGEINFHIWQHQMIRHMDRFDPCWLAWAFRSISTPSYFSSHHSFSFRTCREHTFQKISQKTTQSHIKVVESIFQTCSSSAGVKSFLMLKVFLISSGVLPDQIIPYQGWEQKRYCWWYLAHIIHHQG